MCHDAEDVCAVTRTYHQTTQTPASATHQNGFKVHIQ